ncbi:hypothetical protein Tco_0282703 [Tanacetum coccineum]
MLDFQECLEEIKVEDINWNSLYFSWIQSRLDLGIASTLKEYCDAVSDKEKLLFQRNKSRITMINNEFGETFYDDKVPEPFVIHFREFLGKSQTIQLCLLDKIHFDKMISQNKADWMTRQVTNKEIKHATFNIDDNKAPDLDNFSYRFYKKSWEIIGKDVCAVVKEFFKKGKMLGEVNATLISLIPELDIPTKFSKFRPIAYIKSTMVVKKAIDNFAIWVPLISKQLGINDCKKLLDKVKEKTVINDIDKIMKGFLWNQGDMKNGKAKVSWKMVCYLKVKVGDRKCYYMWFDKWWDKRVISDVIPIEEIKKACFDLNMKLLSLSQTVLIQHHGSLIKAFKENSQQLKPGMILWKLSKESTVDVWLNHCYYDYKKSVVKGYPQNKKEGFLFMVECQPDEAQYPICFVLNMRMKLCLGTQNGCLGNVIKVGCILGQLLAIWMMPVNGNVVLSNGDQWNRSFYLPLMMPAAKAFVYGAQVGFCSRKCSRGQYVSRLKSMSMKSSIQISAVCLSMKSSIQISAIAKIRLPDMF